MGHNSHLHRKHLCVVTTVADNTQNPFINWADYAPQQKELTVYK